MAAAEHRQRAGRTGLQLRADPAVREHPELRSRRCGSTISRRRRSAASFKYSGFSQREQTQQRLDSRLERHADGEPARRADRGDGQLHADADAVPRRRRSATASRTRAAASASAAAAGRSSATRFRSATIANRFNVGLGDLPFIFPEASVIDPRYFVYDLLNTSGSPMWDGTRVLLPPSFSWGNRVSNSPTTRRRTSASRARTSPSSHRHLGQPDEGVGPAHAQDRLLQPVQQQAAGAGRRRRRAGAELPAGRGRHATRATRRSGSPTRRSAVSAPTRRARRASRANTSTTTSKGTCRTTGR